MCESVQGVIPVGTIENQQVWRAASEWTADRQCVGVRRTICWHAVLQWQDGHTAAESGEGADTLEGPPSSLKPQYINPDRVYDQM